jgi:IS30 family transposase
MSQGKYWNFPWRSGLTVSLEVARHGGRPEYAQSDLDKIALRLNQRPRRTSGFETPASKLHASVAPTS